MKKRQGAGMKGRDKVRTSSPAPRTAYPYLRVTNAKGMLRETKRPPGYPKVLRPSRTINDIEKERGK